MNMSKILVLAEKPSVARDIARVLQCNQKLNGALEGSKYIVTWALGHLVTLADPEAYDKHYKTWDIQDLPIMPDKVSLVVIGKTAKQYNAVKSQMLRKDVTEIVIATDAGREGELVARWIIDKAHVKKPLKRLWISSVTDKAIRDGFSHLKNAKDYESLYQSAYSRSIADWFVGINATRALTCKYNAQLACGRVQTPTLAMIAKQEEDIAKFVPRDFYGIKVLAGNIWWTYQSDKKETHLFNQDKIEKIIQSCTNHPLTITSITKTAKKKVAPQLYDLTELQRDANKMYGYSAKETLSIMQDLYEYHKVLTYPRTDSRYLTEDIVSTIKERLDASLGGYHDLIITKILKNPIKKQSHFVNDSKVSDHHAIIPTEQPAMIGSFNDGERNIYELVLKRFLAVLLPPYEYEQTTIVGTIQKENFVARGIIEKRIGFKEVYGKTLEGEDSDDQTLPNVQQKQILTVEDLIQTNGQTKAPAYFNEAALLTAMENPIRFMESASKSLNESIKSTGGLGTVATRADIIEKLFNTFLIEKRGQDIHVTAKGKQLLSLVPNDLRYPELTAKWELELSKIAQGKQQSKQFIKEIRDYTKIIIDEIKDSKATYKHDNMTAKKCPECGNFLLEVNGKKGKMLICSNRDCKYRQSLSIVTNARCPNCHKKLELVGTGDKQMFICKTCGHRQQMSAFKKEKENSKGMAAKQDVKKYLQQQKNAKTAIEDSPFAALLTLKDNLK